MPKFTFEDFVTSLTVKLKQDLQESCNQGHITQQQVDRADYFETAVIGIKAEELHDLMEKAFKVGVNSA